MEINNILQNHDQFREQQLHNRFFKHSEILELIDGLPQPFEQHELGKSFQGRSIRLIKWGIGTTKILLWSQMHGDEATGTMALFDLFNFLRSDAELAKLLYQNCQLHFVPMVNPDGAEAFSRRNAQQIDINRDYLQNLSPEAKILKVLQKELQPDFGFNLHDQSTLWSVSETLRPATLSFLAPAIDEELTIDEVRKNAMLVIADIFVAVSPYLTGHIGLFDDEFEPRAFGDNFQKNGMSTILIEAGGYENDSEKQQIRAYYFEAILSGLRSIASYRFKAQQLENYFSIPKNNKQIFHIIFNQINLDGMQTSIGLNYEEVPDADGRFTTKTYSIQDIGDLSFCDAYQTFHCAAYQVVGTIQLFKAADFKLLAGEALILAFENGKLLQNP